MNYYYTIHQKCILEVNFLTDDEIKRAATYVAEAGIDFH